MNKFFFSFQNGNEVKNRIISLADNDGWSFDSKLSFKLHPLIAIILTIGIEYGFCVYFLICVFFLDFDFSQIWLVLVDFYLNLSCVESFIPPYFFQCLFNYKDKIILDNFRIFS